MPTWLYEKPNTFNEEPMPDKVRRQYYDRMRTAIFLRDPFGEEPDFAVCEKWNVPKTQHERHYEVQMELRRLDQISFRFYGTPFLYWVIALANDIQDPWEPIPVGTVLRIPAIEELDAMGYFQD